MLAVHHLDPGCLRQPAPIARDTLAVTGSVGWTTLCSVAHECQDMAALLGDTPATLQPLDKTLRENL